MAHLQYMPGDPRLVDQLVYELKSKGIFDQFRKECIADVDTRPAYQNLRQRVENSVSTFLSRQCWKPDLNKNQLREKLRKHILDGNYLEQGVERIVDQVVNPKVSTVFIPQVEDLVYNYLGITRQKAPGPETSENKPEDLLPTDLEAVSPGSVKSNDDKIDDTMETDEKTDKMEVDQLEQMDTKEETTNAVAEDTEKKEEGDIEMFEVTVKVNDSESLDKSSIPLPAEEIKLENIPAPENSPPKVTKVELESIALPHEPNLSTDIPLPDGTPKSDKEQYFKPIQLHSEESSSSSDSSLRRNMSPLTPIRSFNNENSCDAQQGFGDDSDAKSEKAEVEKAAPSSFRFTIETKENKTENDSVNKVDKKENDQTDLSYQFNNQVNINTYNTPLYDDSSNSNNLQIDYESDVNSKTNVEMKPEIENSEDSKKEKKSEDKKSSHKSSHRSRDSSRHSSSKDKRSDSKHSTSRDSSRHDKKSSTRDDKSKSSKERERSKDRSDKKDSRDSSKHRSSHKTSSRDKDSKSHRSSSSSHRHSKSLDDKKSSSSISKDKEKLSESSKDRSSKDKSRDTKSSSNRSDKDRKSSSSGKKSDDKDKKKEKKDIDDHYSSSGRGNHSRRSTDRDSNDGSSSSKGSHNQNGSKSVENKKTKTSSSKSDNTSTSGDSPSPSDKEQIVQDDSKISQFKPIIRVENHLETPIANPPRLPFVPDVTLKKPRFAANLQEAKKLMKMRKFLDEEQKRMNQEAALLLEFQANVRPSLSQVYSSIPGPELEFACVTNITPEKSVPYEVTNVQAVEGEKTEEVNKKSQDIESENIPEPAVVNTEYIKIDKSQDNRVDSETVETKTVTEENIEENVQVKQTNPEIINSPEESKDNSYDENKPFSELMDEISVYSKASEDKTKADVEEPKSDIEDHKDTEEPTVTSINTDSKEYSEASETNNVETKYFEVTIITEELSESEEIEPELKNEKTQESEEKIENKTKVPNTEKITQKLPNPNTKEITPKIPDYKLQYFAEHEKYNAELERHEFSNFFKNYTENLSINKKIYLINCDTYEENIVKEMAATFGEFEVVNYYKNGHLKLPNTTKNIVKDVTLLTEVSLPVEPKKESRNHGENSPLFSPVKSECSFELSSDYDTKLEEINKKSRQEVMEIILGSIIDSSPSKMPKIDYYTESSLENETENVNTEVESETENPADATIVESEREAVKRRIDEVESSVNNNRSVLTPHKTRKMSDSDQISSTTEETEVSNNNKVNSTRSKYLGRAKRVGLPRPKRCHLTNSPSSDKSVENYIQNSPAPANGKIKTTPRSKVQRYDTSDLYKPKLHYLSRRNNVS